MLSFSSHTSVTRHNDRRKRAMFNVNNSGVILSFLFFFVVLSLFSSFCCLWRWANGFTILTSKNALSPRFQKLRALTSNLASFVLLLVLLKFSPVNGSNLHHDKLHQVVLREYLLFHCGGKI